MNHLSVEEVAARRAELRNMRELMFRAEVKAKRVSKIKSKTYRRIKKKEREKLAKNLDGDEDLADEGVRLKMEVERARERATLRHKNTGKWAKAMKAKGELDVDERREMLEMLERGEQLRKRIRGDKESEDEDDDDSEVDGERDLSRIKARAFEELGNINKEDGIAMDGQGKKGKSIFEMKFMQDAMARNQQQTDRMVDDFVKEMGGHDGESDAEEVEDAGEDASDRPAVQRTGGRVVYSQSSPPPDHRPASRPVPIPSTSESNPWLVPGETTSKAPRKKNEVVVDKNSSTVDKSKHKLNKQSKALSSNTAVEAPSDDSDAHSEIEEQEKALSQKGKGKSKGVKAFEQRDLVARAFAGDNVVQVCFRF
jgi:U3 small nucleolar RNA-associated protein 14